MIRVKNKIRYILLSLLVTSVIGVFFASQKSFANSLNTQEDSQDTPIYYDQSYDLCYTGCAGWKFYWSRDAVWEYVETMCTMDGTDAAKTLVKFAFNTIVRESADFGPFIQSLFCVGAVKLNLEPKLNQCAKDCTADMWTYAPDLNVATKKGSSMPGVWYTDDGKIHIEIHNGGYVYSPAFKVDVYTATTYEENCDEADNWDQIDSYEVKELAPSVIEKNTLGIPLVNNKTIDWEAPTDACSKVKVVVDPDNRIPELDERDTTPVNNSYVLTINKLPEPPHYQISNIKHELVGDYLDRVNLTFDIENRGEKVGRPKVLVKDCNKGQTLRGTSGVKLELEPDEKETHTIKINDLFWPNEPPMYEQRCLLIEASDGSDVARAQHFVTLFSGTISGTVKDVYGKPIENATVTLNTGESLKTDDTGYFYFSGITKTGEFTVTAKDPNHDLTATKTVTLKLSKDPLDTDQSELHPYVQMVLLDNPAKLKINCPVDKYAFKLTNNDFSYEGITTDADTMLDGILAGTYHLILTKPGYSTNAMDINLEKGKQQTISCGLQELDAYLNDDAITFAPKIKELWSFKHPKEEYLARSAAISGDGSTLYVAFCNAHEQKCELYVFDKTGKVQGYLIIPNKKPYEGVSLKVAYDGHDVLIDDYLIVDNKGNILGQKESTQHNGIYVGFSWDGNLVCLSDGLYNTGFVKVSDKCKFSHFGKTTPNGLTINYCEPVSDGLCTYHILGGDGSPFFKCTGSWCDYWGYDSTYDLSKAVLGIEASQDMTRINYIENGFVKWGANIKGDERGMLSISPNGEYVVFARPIQDLHIFDGSGNDLMSNVSKDVKTDIDNQTFLDIKATGIGIFYVSSLVDQKIHFGVFGKVGQGKKENIQISTSQEDEILQQSLTITPTQEKATDSNSNSNFHAQANKENQSFLGRLWETVVNFFKSFLDWIF